MGKLIQFLLFMVFLSSSALAANNDYASDEELIIGGSNDSDGNATKQISVGLSPKVFARYVTDGTTESSAQWYALATVHPGGSIGYGTAQDVNNIYMKSFSTGDETTTITNNIPTEKDPAATTDADGNEVAAATWTNLGWSLTAPSD
jgi:hypothetical protein